MQTTSDPMETLHIYFEREQQPRPSLLPTFLSVMALSVIVVFGVLSPNQQSVQRAYIRVPAVPTFVRSYSVTVPVIPTGIKTYPATTAHGVLTITNGSVIAQTLPAGLILLSNTGVQVATDAAVFVPAGSADGYGMSTVAAHLWTLGINMSTLSVNQVLGTSLYIRNLQPFTGGHPAYSVTFATAQDRQTAFAKARERLTLVAVGLHYPCSESSNGALSVSWLCTFVSYHIPVFYHVTGVRIIDKNLLLDVWFIPRPVHIWVK